MLRVWRFSITKVAEHFPDQINPSLQSRIKYQLSSNTAEFKFAPNVRSGKYFTSAGFQRQKVLKPSSVQTTIIRYFNLKAFKNK